MTRTRNQYPGKCRRCGDQVAEGEGWRVNGDEGWETVHEVCPDAPEAGPACNDAAEGVAGWAVPAVGLTPEGNRARGYTTHEGPTSTADAVPLNEAARRIARRTELGDLGEAPRGTSGEAWLAVAETAGMLPRKRTADELDAVIGDRDVEAMRRRLEAEREAILRRFE